MDTKTLILPGLEEGAPAERTAKAIEAFYSTSADVANNLTTFLRDYRYLIEEMITKLDKEERGGVYAALIECDEAIKLRQEAQEEMMYAIANQPNPAANKEAQA